MNHVYVYMRDTIPMAVTATRAAAQKAAEDDNSRYEIQPVEYRWDEDSRGLYEDDPRVWQLRIKGRSGRWAKAYRSVHELPLT